MSSALELKSSSLFFSVGGWGCFQLLLLGRHLLLKGRDWEPLEQRVLQAGGVLGSFGAVSGGVVAAGSKIRAVMK